MNEADADSQAHDHSAVVATVMDVMMHEGTAERQFGLSTEASAQLSASSRSKYSDLDWESQKTLLHRLYILENRSLPETRAIMRERGFQAPPKVFKDKFAQWQWKKNIPGDIALWMVEKADDRKRDYGKDSVFSYGGQQWTREQAQNSASRTKKRKIVVTPAGMNVHTPPADNQGPPSRQDIWKVDADSSEHGGLPLSFNGKSAGDFSRMLRAANEFRHQNQLELAEETYREVLEGYGNLLFPTHETTVKLAFQLAGFYVEQGRPADADRIIEKMNYEFMKRWGPDHQKTRQHVMNIAELLNSWGREHDAYALLLHAKDIEEQRNSCLIEDIRSVENENTDTSRVEGFVEFASRKTPYQEVQSLRQCIQQDAGVDNIEYSLIVARSHESSEKSAVEELLIQIESSCSRKAQDLASQALRARAQRLELYRKQASTLEHNPEHVSAFSGTIGFVQLFWSLQRWDNAEFKSFEVLESSLEVAIVLLKSKRLNSAQTIFRAIEKKANCIFSYDDERTIWININIGLAYQTNMGWGHAEQWFDRALCGAHAAYNGNDGILRSLEKAKRNKRFEYVGDEGRPFKTVFGVSGLTIQPNRLHIT